MSADEEENMDDMLTDDYDESDIDTNQEIPTIMILEQISLHWSRISSSWEIVQFARKHLAFPIKM